jgi:hypothetical protein
MNRPLRAFSLGQGNVEDDRMPSLGTTTTQVVRNISDPRYRGGLESRREAE